MELSGLSERQRELIADGIDDAGARLDRYLGQIRDFARRNHEAVFIIRDDLLPGRREMLIVGK